MKTFLVWYAYQGYFAFWKHPISKNERSARCLGKLLSLPENEWGVLEYGDQARACHSIMPMPPVWGCQYISLDKMAAFPQTIFSDTFSWKLCILIKIPLKFVPNSPIDNNLALVQIMAWWRIGLKPIYDPNAYPIDCRIYASPGRDELNVLRLPPIDFYCLWDDSLHITNYQTVFHRGYKFADGTSILADLLYTLSWNLNDVAIYVEPSSEFLLKPRQNYWIIWVKSEMTFSFMWSLHPLLTTTYRFHLIYDCIIGCGMLFACAKPQNSLWAF